MLTLMFVSIPVLPELPLPTPLSHTVGNKSLLFSPRVADEARSIISSNNDHLVGQLVHALGQTNTDHMYVVVNFSLGCIRKIQKYSIQLPNSEYSR